MFTDAISIKTYAVCEFYFLQQLAHTLLSQLGCRSLAGNDLHEAIDSNLHTNRMFDLQKGRIWAVFQ